jgi:hypothetical protein
VRLADLLLTADFLADVGRGLDAEAVGVVEVVCVEALSGFKEFGVLWSCAPTWSPVRTRIQERIVCRGQANVCMDDKCSEAGRPQARVN